MEIVDSFKLEADAKVGTVSERVLLELVGRKEVAKDAAKRYAEAVDQQAKKAGVRKGALKKLVAAHASDKVGDLVRETDSLVKMLEGRLE